MDRLKVLLRRVIDRARVSPNPVVRWTIRRSRDAFRWLGWLLPGLHLGWMAMLRDARWDRDDLVLRGWSYVRGTDHGGSPHHEVYLSRHRLPVWLGGRLARATVRHVPDLDVLSAGHGELDYSGATWEARFAAADLAALPPGEWRVWAKSRGGARRSWGRVANFYGNGTPVVVRRKELSGRLVGPKADLRRGVLIASAPLGLPAAAVKTAGDVVSLVFTSEDAKDLGAYVLRSGKNEVPMEVVIGDGRVTLSATVPEGNALWTVKPKSGGRKVTLPRDALAVRPRRDSSLFVRPAVDRSALISRVPFFVEVDEVRRDADELRLTGSLAGDAEAFDLVLTASRAELPVTILSVDHDGRFVATAPLLVSVWGGPELPAPRGAYVLEARERDGDAPGFGTYVSQSFLAQVPTVDTRTDLRLRFELAGKRQLQIAVTRPRAVDEYGTHNQRRLFNEIALGTPEPVDAVYFESFFGRSATCNPRAIDAEVARRRPELQRYWSVDDLSIAVPDGAIPLVIGTRRWWEVRESARWVVTNEWLRGRYVKQPFQTVLQTWHGSMYKRIGMDRGGAGFRGGGHIDRARTERANWDLFISQNGDTTPIIQQAYDFRGEDASSVLEIGYPRNGELIDIDPDRVAEIRRRVGIPPGSRVVMYAPTWRESSQNVELMSLPGLAAEVSTGYTFLQRGHVRTLEDTAAVNTDAVIDVSTYPQINDLFMVTDLLITDYSSMMFDYSVTGRPMLFYTPDIDEYTDPRVRGAYFDLDEVAPGPVVRTVPEVVELVQTMDEWVPAFADRYAAWHQRFNHLDDGHAAERAVDALFAFEPDRRRRTAVRPDYAPTAGEDG
jgi:CDP-glycerol glycerophosphotransferase (TagB/SpsB family)